MKTIAAKFGFVGGARDRSLLFFGDDAAAFDALSPLITEINGRDSRMQIVLVSASSAIRTTLEQRFPALQVVSPPFANGLAAAIFLRQLKVRAVAFVENAVAQASPAFLAKLHQLAIGVVTVTGRGPESIGDIAAAIKRSEDVVVFGEQTPAFSIKGISVMPVAELTDKFAVMLARDLKALRKPHPILHSIATLPLRISTSARWQGAITWRVKRYSAVETLNDRLGHPKTIMCLGNGPSSESPELDSMQHDALFRVNHSWLKRGLRAKPNVVFTGGKASMRAISGAIFGVPTPDSELALLKLRTYNPLLGRTEYFNVNDMTLRLAQFDWGHLRPTNGACMLAAAVALQPEKLIVAGIDLFQHPEGSYPGDQATANAYSPGHSRETEFDFVFRLLTSFRGELVIVGDILRKAIENHMVKSS